MKLVKYVLLSIALVYSTIDIYTALWKTPQKVIEWDIIDYYCYLPATFIYGDVSMKFREKDPEFFADKIWARKLENGNYVVKMSMGLSMMYLPFFLSAHWFSLLTGFPADGYSPPYAFALIFASLFYFIVGLWLLARLLRTYFNDKTVAFVLLAIGLGTNVSNYIIREAAMSHTFSFFLFSAFLFLTKLWYDNNKFKTTILLGLTFGLISLVRPSNSIIILVFLLWDIRHLKEIPGRIQCILKSYRHVLVIFFFTLLVWLPQLLYWKYTTGSFLYYSYSDEGFFFGNPNILHVLFGFRKGWFVYTPLMLFAAWGFVYLYKHFRHLFYLSLLFIVVNIYIISSWWCWWYGGSYGQRAMIESMTIMAFPLSAFIQQISQKKYMKRLLNIFIFGIIIQNGFNNYKYLNGSLHYDSMTGRAYFETMLKRHATQAYYEKLIVPDYENAKKGLKERTIPLIPKAIQKEEFIIQELTKTLIFKEDFEDSARIEQSLLPFLSREQKNSCCTSFQLTPLQIYRPATEFSVDELKKLNPKGIGIEIYYFPTELPEEKSLGLTISFENDGRIISYNLYHAEPQALKINQWNMLQYTVQMPSNYSDSKLIKCYLWNINGKAKGYVDDFSVYVFTK